MNRIFQYLLASEAEGNVIRGLKVLDPKRSRAENVMERLNAFNINELSYEDLLRLNPSIRNQPNVEWYLYRKIALKAINQYIIEFPFLMHTPSSLRAVFGIPTRKDRKRGRYSGKELIETALHDIDDFSTIINYEAIFELQECLKDVIQEFPQYKRECKTLINYLEENIQRNSMIETFTPEISTHSVDSLEKGKQYLETHGITEVIHEAEPEYPYTDENKVLTPDFIGKYWDTLVWFELKEWTNFNNFLSPIKQILTYLSFDKEQKSSYVGILVENRVDFFNFLLEFDSVITFDDLRSALLPYINEAQTQSDRIHTLRKIYLKIGKIMVEEFNLQIKPEALYIGLFSEIVNKEIGMVNSEMEAGNTILELLATLEKSSNELRLIPIEQLKTVKDRPNQNYVLFLGDLNIATEDETVP